MARDIVQDTLNVGNAMTSVRIDQMILNLAKGIAWGQFELDKVGVDITRMMGAPGTVNIGGEQLSMLEAGFTPSFYHFVDTILEMKMEINIREEQSSSTNVKEKTSTKSETNYNVSASVEGGFWGQKYKVSGSYGGSSSSAYTKAVDTTTAQKFSQDLSASSLMRTKIVPIPPPEMLLERIKILLEKLRKEAEEDEAKSEAAALEALGPLLFSINNITASGLDVSDDTIVDTIYEAFKGKTDHVLLKKMEISRMDESEDGDKKLGKWIVKDRADNKYVLTCSYAEETEVVTVEVRSGGETQNDHFGFGELLNVPL